MPLTSKKCVPGWMAGDPEVESDYPLEVCIAKLNFRVALSGSNPPRCYITETTIRQSGFRLLYEEKTASRRSVENREVRDLHYIALFC